MGENIITCVRQTLERKREGAHVEKMCGVSQKAQLCGSPFDDTSLQTSGLVRNQESMICIFMVRKLIVRYAPSKTT